MTFTQLTLNDKTICLSGEITKIETVSRRAGNNSSFNNYVPVKSITKGSILNILFSETDILFNNIYKQTFSTDIVDKSGFYPFVYDNKVVFVYGLYKIDKADLGKYFAPSSLPDKIERTNSFFRLSTMNNKGELMSSKVVEDIDINGYGLEVQNILNNDVFPILLPFKRAALGLNESITYYSLQPSNK